MNGRPAAVRAIVHGAITSQGIGRSLPTESFRVRHGPPRRQHPEGSQPASDRISLKYNKAVHIRAMFAPATPDQLHDVPPGIVQSGPEATPRLPARSWILRPDRLLQLSFA